MRKKYLIAEDNRYFLFVFDFFSFLFILSAPYLVFIDNMGFIFEIVNLLFIVSFAVFAVVLSFLLRLSPFVLLRVFILTILLLLFIDIQFDWLQWWGKKSAVAIGVALFLILWILRTHVSQILAVVFGTIIAATLGTSLLSHSLQNNFLPGPSLDNHETRLPLYVHIILDEQIGIEGFDNDIQSHNLIRREMISFFTENRFLIFSRAYSKYFNSNDSIASILNAKFSANTRELYEQLYSRKARYLLLKNSYFENLLTLGYEINVYQSIYMNFCRSNRIKIHKCLTYTTNDISGTALTNLTFYEKTLVVLAIYGEYSFIIFKIKKVYKNVRGYLGEIGMILPDWANWSGRVGPIPTLAVFDTLIKDVSEAPGGSMFFAHLLIPHFPYSVDSVCKIRRPVVMWSNRSVEFYYPDKTNSPRSRLARYEEYIPQIRCALLKLEELFDALKTRGAFEDAIIIVHGDHGSRIVLVEPEVENKDRLSRQDFYDAFSTLYVVKSPGIAPGYDTRMMAISELLQNTVSGNINASIKSEPDTRPTVFLRGSGKPTLQEVLMPYLPITNR